MELQEDSFKEIAETQRRFFGGPGTMLIPSIATVEAAIKRIPERQLMTADLLRKTLANQFEVQGTCPVTTRKALRALANDAGKDVAYWRVVKANGELMAYYPGGVEGHAARLRQEGFIIDATRKVPRVQAYKKRLALP